MSGAWCSAPKSPMTEYIRSQSPHELWKASFKPRDPLKPLSPAAALLELQQHSLFAPFVELALARTIVLNREQLGNKVILNEAVMHFAPAPDVVYRQAALLALDGQEDSARTQWDLSVANYPGERARMLQGLEAVASREALVAGLVTHARTKIVEGEK